jgi:sterol desaturase/sphingolipid hydroxylase (fatty acid hydroxylase superfamily)
MGTVNMVFGLLCGVLAFCALVVVMVRVMRARLKFRARILENIDRGVYRNDAQLTRRTVVLVAIALVVVMAVCAGIILGTVYLFFPGWLPASWQRDASLIRTAAFVIALVVILILEFFFKQIFDK